MLFHFSLELAVEFHSGIGSKCIWQLAAGGDGYGGPGGETRYGAPTRYCGPAGSMRDRVFMAQATTYAICLSEPWDQDRVWEREWQVLEKY